MEQGFEVPRGLWNLELERGLVWWNSDGLLEKTTRSAWSSTARVGGSPRPGPHLARFAASETEHHDVLALTRHHTIHSA